MVCLAACGLSMGGLGDVAGDGGTLPGEDGSSGGSSSGIGSSGSGSGASSSGTGSSSGGTGDAGGSQDSTSPSDGGGGDSTAPPDSSAQDAPAEVSPPQDTGTVCNASAGCYVIPGGWQLVAFVDNQTTACPTGFGSPTNLYEDPDTSSSCSCSACSISTQPACDTGAISADWDDPSLFVGGGSNCSNAGTPATLGNNPAGQCGTDLYNKGGQGVDPPYSAMDLKYVPANQPTGGQCTTSTVTGPVNYAAEDQACQPTSQQAAGCNGNQCTPGLQAPYQACVVKSGSNSCPGSPFTQQHVVGTGYGLTCSTCDCSVSATCNWGTMELFTDTGCSQGEFEVPADGGCDTNKAPAQNYQSYKYVANAPTNVSCSTGTSTASGSLQGEQTICCVP